MKFIAKCSTDDKRLTANKIYSGQLLWKDVEVSSPYTQSGYRIVPELRICVYDDKGEWMTFSPSAFLPSDLLTSAMRPVSPE